MTIRGGRHLPQEGVEVRKQFLGSSLDVLCVVRNGISSTNLLRYREDYVYDRRTLRRGAEEPRNDHAREPEPLLRMMLHHGHDRRLPASRRSVDHDRLCEGVAANFREDRADDVLAALEVDTLVAAEFRVPRNLHEKFFLAEGVVRVLGLRALDEVDGVVRYRGSELIEVGSVILAGRIDSFGRPLDVKVMRVALVKVFWHIILLEVCQECLFLLTNLVVGMYITKSEERTLNIR